MTGITRRDSLILGGAAIGAAGLPIIGARAAEAGADVPTADVKPPEYKIEKGAKLHVLRPAKFLDPDQTYWDINTKKFTKETGVPVAVNYISWEDLRPQTAVAANTGAGPDIIVGFSSDPFVYTDKLIPMTDLADYLGAKYGGWYDLAVLYGTKWKSKNDWISIPIGGGLGPAVYRESWVKEVGFDGIPDDLDGFLKLCKALQKAGHPCGFTFGHALGDANNNTEWCLWAHNGMVVDQDGKVALDSKETIAALKFGKEWFQTMIPGTLSWNDSGNNKAWAAGKIGMTFNGVSIYWVMKNSKDPKLRAIGADTKVQTAPRGLATAMPQTSTVVNAMVFKHTKYPNAAKEYVRFMMESPQYGAWLSHCWGYWSNPLKAYSSMKFWDSDPNLKPYAKGMDTPYYDGYSGPISAASAAVVANYTVVDMFAKVASGNASAESAAKEAARAAKRYYKM